MGLIKKSKRLQIPDKSMKRVKGGAFKSPGINDLGTMKSRDIFNVDKGTAGLSTAGMFVGDKISQRGSAIVDLGTSEGRKLTKKARI